MYNFDITPLQANDSNSRQAGSVTNHLSRLVVQQGIVACIYRANR